MAAVRAIFSSSVFLGNAKASINKLNTLASACASESAFSRITSAFCCKRCISSCTSSYPFLSNVKFATISANAAPVAAVNAAIAPPPGVGSFDAVAATKSFTELVNKSIYTPQ